MGRHDYTQNKHMHMDNARGTCSSAHALVRACLVPSE